jgi:calcineurin-like phosphoesterase family protein
MKYWIITDTHFQHKAMAEHCGRPENFEEIILKNISRIPENDVLIHLGDFSWGNCAYWCEKYFKAHPKRNWLIKGNHDKRTDSWYLDQGFDFVAGSVLLSKFGYRILLTHIPWEPTYWYDRNVHGHLHNTGHHETYKDGKHICVYIEHHYSPQLLKTIVGK